MSLSGYSDRPSRSKRLTEKGGHLLLEKVSKLIQEAEKTYKDAHALGRQALEEESNELASSFENSLEALSSVKKAIEGHFDQLAVSGLTDEEIIKQVSRVSEWLRDIGDREDELHRRFKRVPHLWQLAAGKLLDDEHEAATSVVSTTSTMKARAEAAAARKRMELEEAQNRLIERQLQEEVREKEEEIRREAIRKEEEIRREVARREEESRAEVAKKKRELELQRMKTRTEYEVAQARLEALEDGSSRCGRSESARSGRSKKSSTKMDCEEDGRMARLIEEAKKKRARPSSWCSEDLSSVALDGASEVQRLVPPVTLCGGQDVMGVMMETQRALLYGVPKLVPFTGKVEDFFEFMATWMSTVGAPGGSPAYKLQLLLSNLDAKSRSLVSHCSYLNPEQGYKKAIDELYKRYGRGDVLVDAFMEKMKKMPKIQMGDSQKLEAFADALDQSVLALEELGKQQGGSDYLCMASNVRSVAELLLKLPIQLRDRYVKRNGIKSACIKRLRDFLKKESEEANNPVLRVCKELEGRMHEKSSQRRDTAPKKEGGSSAFATSVMPCYVCKSDSHPVHLCPSFRKMLAKERLDLLKKANRCFNCFSDGHQSRECDKPSFCKKECGWLSPHSWFMHDREVKASMKPKTKKKEDVQDKLKTSDEKDEKTEVANACELSERKAFFQVVPVRVRSSKGTVTCWAMLDPCSSAHFGSEKLSKLLHLSGKQKDVTLRTMNGTRSQSVSVADVFVSGSDRAREFRLREVKFQDSNDLSLSAVPKAADCEQWPQLESVVGKVEHEEVLLLIGLEAREIFQQGKGGSGPYLVETGLGRAVQGLVGDGAVRQESANFVEVEDSRLEEKVRRFFDIEDCQALYDDTKAMSMEDRKAIKMIESTTKKLDGRYEVRVPWRRLPPTMPNNRHQALVRINCLRKKFLQDQEGLQAYAKAITDYERNGFAEKVPGDELKTEEGRASWLCHHGVKHERKPLRIVFNASKLCEGKSLNTEILQGPDLLSKLIGILLRFRRHTVAVSADIKAFFHQVRIPKCDVDFQRYLWFEDSDPQKGIVEMRMLVHLFGGISSQTCSVAALQRCIQDSVTEGEVDKTFADEASRSFYCDDFLRSFKDSEEAKTFSLKLKEILKQGGFRLVKFLSTDRNILQELPKEDVVEACREESSLEEVKSSALGISWHVGKDVLSFPSIVKHEEVKMTKRELLSFIASIFDPLGMLGPVVATAKMILSAVFRKGLEWDEPLQEEEGSLFVSWLKSLVVLEEFFLPRCVSALSIDQDRELHVFSDGAEPGYGCCAYIVFKKGPKRRANFLMSKSKVCSKKGKLTTPKVELCGAVLATRVARIIKRELEEPFDRVYFWTDSTSTLKMIKNDRTRFKVFEANRLEEIRSCSDKSSWRFVPGKQNPSDVLTRPFQLDCSFSSDHFFFKGPAFIEQAEEEWPEQPELRPEEEVEDCLMTSSKTWSEVEDLFPKIGSWMKLKKFVAVMIRLQRSRRGTIVKGCLSVEELSSAEDAIFKRLQEHYFQDELSLIQAGKALSKSHHLAKYSPFLLDGILRVSGRLNEAEVDFDLKHPIILPKSGHVTELLVNLEHQRNYHGTAQMVLNGLRQRFHVPDALRLIKKIVGRCFDCKRYSQRLGEQIMAGLPPERIAVGEPPFTHAGCDVAGPFLVKRARKIQKRYICLFTCMTVRAVHLEVLENLEADTFLNALRRFLARRGPVKTMRTDNGLNFRGGDKEIRQAIQAWNDSDIGAREEFRNHGVAWRYQTPKASSHSGVWERMIRSMRSHLRHVLKNQEVPEDVFHTLVVEVESILNSRPLVPVSEDPEDLTALTPSMILNMKQTCSPSPGVFDRSDLILKKRWRQAQAFVDMFWRRFTKEYLSTLISRQKWVRHRRNFAEGDLVLVVDELLPRSHWPLGRVTRVYPGRDSQVRSVQVKTKTGVYDRPIYKLALMETDERN